MMELSVLASIKFPQKWHDRVDLVKSGNLAGSSTVRSDVEI